MKIYKYAIIKENYSLWQGESVSGQNNYDPSKRYVLIIKQSNQDHTESILDIFYSDDLQAFQEKAVKFVSWYNYPIGIGSDMMGNLRKIN